MRTAIAVAALCTGSLPASAWAQETELHVYGTFLPFLENVRATGATAPGLSPATGGAALVPEAAYTGASLPQRRRITSGTSNLGFKGTLVVNEHLKVFWQVESAVSPDGDAPNALAGRNTAVGLTGDWGTAFYGNWDTPYKLPLLYLAPLRGLNPFDDYVTANPGFNVPGTTTQTGRVGGKADAAFSRRQGNSIQYWTPAFHGLSARLAYSTNEGRTAETATAASVSPQLFSALVTYERGPFGLRYAHERHEDYFGLAQLGGSPGATRANGASTDQGHEVVAWYALPTGTKLSGVWERLAYDSDDTTAGAVDHYARNAWYALLQQRIGNHQAWGAFGRAYQGDARRVGGGDASTSGLAALQWSVGYSYRLAKSADLFASYYEVRNDRSASYSPFPGFGTVAPGADSRGVGLGILFTFDVAWTVKP